MNSKPYIGRYAPSPTGELHLGNLRTALIAWLHARLNKGEFLLRIEDLDIPRVKDGSAEQILRDLELLGIDWDGEVLYQSVRTDVYQQALNRLAEYDLTFPCFCSRADIRNAASAPHTNGLLYPGTCRNLSDSDARKYQQSKTPAIRLQVSSKPICYRENAIVSHTEILTDSCGDFVLKRSDGLFAYQLAVVVDDLEQNVTHVVRGLDLADSTARQVYLAQLLKPNRAQMMYTHVALLLDHDNNKMAKRDGSTSLSHAISQGWSVEQLVGEFASQLGLLPAHTMINAQDLLQDLTLARLELALNA